MFIKKKYVFIAVYLIYGCIISSVSAHSLNAKDIKKNATRTHDKHIAKNHLMLSGASQSSAGFSAAKNFLNAAQVNQQTGALSVGFPVAAVHDGIQGASFTLELSDSFGAYNNRFDLGDDWGFNLGYQSYIGSSSDPDARIQSITTDTGQTYPFQVALKDKTRLHKLQDAKKVDNSDGSVTLFLKNGDNETFSKLENDSGSSRISGVLEKKCFSNGQCLDFNYADDMGTGSSNRQLSSIVDDKTDKVLVSLDWSHYPQQITISSMDNQGQLDKTVTVQLDSDYGVTSIADPEKNVTNFTYCGSAPDGTDDCVIDNSVRVYNEQLYQINYPTGLTTQYKYGPLPTFNGAGTTNSPVVGKVIEYPRGVSNASKYQPLTTTYSFYSNSDDHTYKGFAAYDLGNEPGVDPLYGADTGYTYTTSKDTGLATTTYTYNRLHLLVRQATYEDTSDGQGPLLTYTDQCYPGAVSGNNAGDLGICSSDDTYNTSSGTFSLSPVDTGVSYDALPADYSFAKATYTHLVPLSGRDSGVTACTTSSTALYDNTGNQIKSTDAMGITKATVFCQTGDNPQKGCPANTQFVKYPLKETETGSQGKLSQLNKFAYASIPGEPDPRATGKWFGYLQGGSTPVVWKKSSYSYCNTDDKACNSADLAGLLSDESTSTVGSSPQTMGIKTTYSLNSADNAYTQSVSMAAGSQKSDKESSLYTGAILSAQAGNDGIVKTTYLPDGQVKGREQCSSDGSNCQTLIAYQYLEAENSPDGLNHIITTYPGGWQTNEAYDGVNHLIYDESGDSGGDKAWSSPAQTLWTIHGKNTYDQYGRPIITETLNNTGDSPTDIVQYYYTDAAARNNEKVWPKNKDGEQLAKTSLVDVAYNRTITFTHLINAASGDEPLQAIGAVDSDNDSRITGKYRISVDPNDYTGDLKTELTALESSFQSLDDSLMNHEDIIGKVEDFVSAAIKAKEYYQFHTYQYDGLERLLGEHINGHEVEQYVYSPEGLLESSISTYPQDGEASSKQTNYGYDCLNGQVDRLTVVSTIDNTPQALCAVQ